MFNAKLQPQAYASPSDLPVSQSSLQQRYQQQVLTKYGYPSPLQPPVVAPILVMTVDIGEDEQDQITVFEGDDVHAVALKFGEKHKLDEESIKIVEENLLLNVQKALQSNRKIKQQQSQFLQSSSNKENLQNSPLQNMKESIKGVTPQKSVKSVSQSRSNSKGSETKYTPSKPFTVEDYQKWKKEQNLKFKQQHDMIDEKYIGKIEEIEGVVEKEPAQFGSIQQKIQQELQKRSLDKERQKTMSSGLEEMEDILEEVGEYLEEESGRWGKMSGEGGFEKIEEIQEEQEQEFIIQKQEKPIKSNGPMLLNPNENDKLTYQNKSFFSSHKKKKPLPFSPIEQKQQQKSKRKQNQSSQNLSKGLSSIGKQFTTGKNKGNSPKAKKAKKTGKKTSQFSTTSDQPKNDTQQPGVRLYNQALRNMKLRDQIAKKAQKERQKLTPNHVFHPQINEISNQLCEQTRQDGSKIEDKLLRFGQQTKRKVQQQKMAKKLQEQNEFNFKPKISYVSERIIQEKSRLMGEREETVFEELYNQAQRKQEIMRRKADKYYEEVCTFSPKILDDSERPTYRSGAETSRSQMKSTNLSYFNELSFLERQTIYNEYKCKKVESLQKQKHINERYDEKSGQELFKPKISKYDPRQRQKNKPIEQRLIEEKAKRKMRKNLQRKSKKLKIKEDSKVKLNKKSKKIIEKLKRKKLVEIFKLLDHNDDGLISSSKIDIGKLTTEVLEIFSPLLIEMEDTQVELDQESFVEAGMKVFECLDIRQKDSILYNPIQKSGTKQKLKKLRQKHGTDHSFKPKINPKSKSLAKRKMYKEDSESGASPKQLKKDKSTRLYDRFWIIKKRKEKNQKEMQELLQKKEMEGCTFKPVSYTEGYQPEECWFVADEDVYGTQRTPSPTLESFKYR